MTDPKILIDYNKYRWFFTSSKKIVVGGKSSSQNDELLKKLKSSKQDFVVMHTSSPGSPFTVILEKIANVSQSDIDETAIFTGCFSRQWREGKKQTVVDIFNFSQLRKSNSMKQGQWGISGAIKRKTVTLELVLTKQEGKLRAVPEKTVKKKSDRFIKICPGNLDKTNALPKIQVEISQHLNQDELLSALPAGGIAICRN